jgi:hypothetical protein
MSMLMYRLREIGEDTVAICTMPSVNHQPRQPRKLQLREEGTKLQLREEGKLQLREEGKLQLREEGKLQLREEALMHLLLAVATCMLGVHLGQSVPLCVCLDGVVVGVAGFVQFLAARQVSRGGAYGGRSIGIQQPPPPPSRTSGRTFRVIYGLMGMVVAPILIARIVVSMSISLTLLHHYASTPKRDLEITILILYGLLQTMRLVSSSSNE